MWFSSSISPSERLKYAAFIADPAYAISQLYISGKPLHCIAPAVDRPDSTDPSGIMFRQVAIAHRSSRLGLHHQMLFAKLGWSPDIDYRRPYVYLL